MLSRFKQYILHKNLISPGENILLAVSGGIDSIVMSYLFSRLSHPFEIAHCNFHLRGAASDQDALFVENWAKKLGAPFHLKSFLKEENPQEGISTQMWARKQRYAWFDELCHQHAIDLIATAHQANDVLETLFLNLVRGTGIAGLHGIQARQSNIIRPLLFASKAEVQAYAHSEGLSWREDASNQENIYERNLIRNRVVPILKELNPNLEHTLLQSVEKFAGVEKVFLSSQEKAAHQIVEKRAGKIWINKGEVEQLPAPALQLFHFLAPYGFSYPQAKQILASKDIGARFPTASYELIQDRLYYIIEEIKAPLPRTTWQIEEYQEGLLTPDFKIDITRFDKGSLDKMPNDQNIASLDFEKLKFPLKLRLWEMGDYFYPLGMRNKKKISDFLINEKVNLLEKRKTYVLVSGDEIAWVLGRRLDDRYKIRTKTQLIYQLKMNRIYPSKEH